MSSDQIDSGGTISLSLSGVATVAYVCPVCQRDHEIYMSIKDMRDWPGVSLTCQVCSPRDFEVYLLVKVDGHHRQLINP